MEPVIVASVPTLPALVLLLIPFHDEPGAAGTCDHLAGGRPAPAVTAFTATT